MKPSIQIWQCARYKFKRNQVCIKKLRGHQANGIYQDHILNEKFLWRKLRHKEADDVCRQQYFFRQTSHRFVPQARKAAQPLRRSVAGQIEYWATLGRIVEHSGLTAQEAQAAIEGYEAATKKAREKVPDSLEALKLRLLAASTNGALQTPIRTLVEENCTQAVQPAAD